jgi:hypothetical protein
MLRMLPALNRLPMLRKLKRLQTLRPLLIGSARTTGWD